MLIFSNDIKYPKGIDSYVRSVTDVQNKLFFFTISVISTPYFSNFNQTRSLISTHQRDQNFYFSEMNRFRQRFRRRGSLYLLNQHLLIRESTAWKDWILKLMFRMDKLSDCRRHNGRGEWVLIINAIYLCPTFDNAFQF